MDYTVRDAGVIFLLSMVILLPLAIGFLGGQRAHLDKRYFAPIPPGYRKATIWDRIADRFRRD